MRSDAAAASQSAYRSCSSARCSFGIAWYAASRIRRCRNRKASSPANSARSGRISSFLASVRRRERTFGLAESGLSVVDGARVEHLALDRASLDHAAFLGVEPIEARRQQQVDRRRHGHVREVFRRTPRPSLEAEQSVVDQHREHLLDEQRVPLSCLEDPVARHAWDVRATEEVVDEEGCILARERLEHDRRRVQPAPAPTGPHLEQLGPRDAEDQHRGLARPIREVLDQVEERRFRPVDVVEHEDDRALASEMLEQLADRPERVLRGAELSPAEQAGDLARDPIPIGCAGEDRVELGPRRRRWVALGDPRSLMHHVREWEEGDPFAVREASSAEEGRLASRPRLELVDEARLPDACRPHQREEVGGSFGHGALERVLEEGELLRSADHRRVEVSLVTGGVGGDGEQPVRRHPLLLALQCEGVDRLDLDGILHQPVGRIAQEDLARGSSLLQPGGHVHRISGDQALPGHRVAGHHLAGVHADPRGQALTMLPFEIDVQRGERLTHLDRGANGADRVVLVQSGIPKTAITASPMNFSTVPP